MNLLLSKRGDYVVRSALCLANAYESGQQRKIREVVVEMGVPRNYASQILSELVKAGLATSRAGRDGGYMLAREPGSITLLDVVEAGEGSLRPDRCTLGDGPCRWDQVCPLHETWTAMVATLRSQLAETSLADLAQQDRARDSGAAWMPETSHRPVRTSIPVEDWVHIDLGVPAIADRLQHDGWLAGNVREAYGEAESLRGRIGPGTAPWKESGPPTVLLGTPETKVDGATYMSMAWEVSMQGGSDSRLEGELQLRPLDPDRTEVHLVGRFRPPGGPDQRSEPDETAGRLSQVTVRALLRRVARAVEV